MDQNSIEYRQRNALAWRVVSELCRRDNNLFVGPKGGDDTGVDANALMVLSPAGLKYQARRYGLGFVAMSGNRYFKITWEQALTYPSARAIALSLEQSIGFSLPAHSPPTTPRALGYRVLASLLELTAAERGRWIERSTGGGSLDLLTEPHGRAQTWEDTRFEILKDGERIAEFDNYGWVRAEDRLINLQTSYKMLGRNVRRVVVEHFAHHFK